MYDDMDDDDWADLSDAGRHAIVAFELDALRRHWASTDRLNSVPAADPTNVTPLAPKA